MTLTEFLLARIAEDEAVARAATAGMWEWEPPSEDSFPQSDESLVAVREGWRVCKHFCRWSPNNPYSRGEQGSPGHEHRNYETVVSGWGYDASGINAEESDRVHIARHDPARALAECEAKRRIVDLRDSWAMQAERAPDVAGALAKAQVSAADAVLRSLAAVYAYHPDYCEDRALEAHTVAP